MLGHQAAVTVETKNRNSESGLALRALYHTNCRSLDLFEGLSVAGDRFYVVERLFASGKVSQEYRGLLRLLYLGESVAQSDLKPFIELIQLLADAGIVIPEDGIGASCKTRVSSWRMPTSRCSTTKSLGCTCSGRGISRRHGASFPPRISTSHACLMGAARNRRALLL